MPYTYQMKSERNFAFLRIAFGGVWGIDAWFKWQPAFQSGLTSMLTAMLDGQPAWVASWIELWIKIVSVHPYLFAILIALTETAIALSLIFGFLTRMALGGSMVFAFLIWSVAEGFGGPYVAGSTDIGCAVIYIFVAIALWLGASWRAYSIDAELEKKYPNFFLWKDSAAPRGLEDKKDVITVLLVLGIIILGSILLVEHAPNMQTGPGAMAPAGMTLKTFDLKPSDPVPTVNFTIARDPVSMGGWDIHITPTNFIFTPQNVNSAPVADEGHVHLYVDNTMYIVYGNWYHLDDVSAGPHTITVALFANDHSIFSENGQYIEATTTITQ
jgi:thiosulfate dehydrogenase (quinone) large subunit